MANSNRANALLRNAKTIMALSDIIVYSTDYNTKYARLVLVPLLLPYNPEVPLVAFWKSP